MIASAVCSPGLDATRPRRCAHGSPRHEPRRPPLGRHHRHHDTTGESAVPTRSAVDAAVVRDQLGSADHAARRSAFGAPACLEQLICRPSTDRALRISDEQVSSPYSTVTALACRNGHWSSPGAGALPCLSALEVEQFFASHLAELPERINTGSDHDQITQVAH